MLRPSTPLRSVKSPLQPYCQTILQGLPDVASRESGCWTIGVTSCRRRSGTSTLAANLAIASAQAGQGPVLLVDAQPERPAFHEMFDLPLSPGLADALAATEQDSLPVQPTAVTSLDVLTAGEVDDDATAPEECFHRFPDYLADAAGQYRRIVVDLPPVDVCSRNAAMLHALDGVVLLAQAKRTKKAEVSVARRALEVTGTDVWGIVINRQKRSPGWMRRLLGKDV